MQRTEERTVDDYQVTVTQHPSTRGFRLLTRLGKVITPVLNEATDVVNAKTDIKNLDLAALGPMLSALFSQLDDDSAEALLVEVLACTIVVYRNDAGELEKGDLSKGKPAIDRAFGGRLPTMLKVAMFAVEVNFRDFFGGSGKSLKPQATTPSE